MENFKYILQLLRIRQWHKNFFIFLPLFFDGKILQLQYITKAIIVFVTFCLLSSSIYCLNDIKDRKKDALHPEKCKRPLASGKLKTSYAYVCMFVCLILSFLLPICIESDAKPQIYLILSSYFILNLLYTVYLKQISVLDVFIVSVGYVMRVFCGGFACHIFVSEWIIMMTFLLALFLTFCKRRDDLVLFESDGIAPRKSVMQYNLVFLNQVITVISAVCMVCYIMYTLSADVQERFHTQYLYVTSIWVLAGIIRYLQLTLVEKNSGDPSKVLLKDRFIQFCVLLWIINFVIIIYC
ncbi:MAG: decaprenyl-phosphate phosphoribosyltransferase [Bacteroidales bacterium]|nr:decaprenyl-phosphate phosphoribosyltransferase [Bacteroidales bacterium]